MKSKHCVLSFCIFGFLLLASVLVFAPASRSARACEPTQEPPGYIPPTPIPIETQVAGVIQDAQIVLDGTVQTWVESPNMHSILTVQVERYLKGHGPKTVQISGYFWDCPPNFALQPGARYVFFTNGDPASTEPLQVREWFGAQEAVVASVRNSTGQEPSAPEGAYDVIWVSLLAIITLGLSMLRFRQRRS